MIENWKDLVGYQPYSAEHQPMWKRPLLWLLNWLPDRRQKVFYLTYKNDPDGRGSFVIMSEMVTCNLTEKKLCEQLDTVLTSFPKGNYPFSDIGKSKAGIQVARQSRRGMAKVEYYNRSIFYRGSSAFDAAVFVTKRGGRYGIFKHPDFEKYGFTFGKDIEQ
jgi:hypothetical protein